MNPRHLVVQFDLSDTGVRALAGLGPSRGAWLERLRRTAGDEPRGGLDGRGGLGRDLGDDARPARRRALDP